MPDATRLLTSCLHHCQELSWSHDTAATNISRLTLTAVEGLVGLKCSRKLTNYLIKLKINKSKLHSKSLGPRCKYMSRPLWSNSAIIKLKIN